MNETLHDDYLPNTSLENYFDFGHNKKEEKT